ncbi:TssQ family T6SS-associated lipoprotein [Massilia oculi]|uniref:TssQ family T6SS-associated lipoprotein n=1 Tax=Massilia oculi TaxID=945844 RepID=UPI001AAFE372|nr:TssQ family T6SS-associated lipoprotein [Massilia oculi]
MSIVTMSRAATLAALALAATTLVGCAQFGPMFGGQEKARPHPRADGAKPRAQRAQQASRPAAPAPKRDDVALREGIALYDKGDYDGAIRRLNGSDMNGAGQRERLTALKYTAFSYCVTGRQALCRQTFDRAFKLDPSFDLGPGEHGHPQWGPVFAQAKQAVKH